MNEEKLDKILEILNSEQKLNASRHYELRAEIASTKDELNQVCQALSEDIAALHTDQAKITKGLDSHERRIKKIENKVLLA